MDIGVVVSAKLVFLLRGEAAQRLGDIAVGVLAADHEADLAGWVGWDGGVGVFDRWEDLLAVLLELGDQWEVEPLVLSCVVKLAGVTRFNSENRKTRKVTKIGDRNLE